MVQASIIIFSRNLFGRNGAPPSAVVVLLTDETSSPFILTDLRFTRKSISNGILSLLHYSGTSVGSILASVVCNHLFHQRLCLSFRSGAEEGKNFGLRSRDFEFFLRLAVMSEDEDCTFTVLRTSDAAKKTVRRITQDQENFESQDL